MIKNNIIIALLLTGLFFNSNWNAYAVSDNPLIVPVPVQMTIGEGDFQFSPNTVFAVENREQKKIVDNFAALFAKAAGFTPKVETGVKEAAVRLTTDVAMKPEAYHLQVSAGHIQIKAADEKGFFYALQTLRLLLPPVIENVVRVDTEWKIPAVTINDEPRFGYRGMMLDVSRFFTPKKEVLRIIDCMAMLKLNMLHFHLSDDNGWRLEIKKYPRLTEVGAWCVNRGNATFPDRRNQKQGEPTPKGGFYTQEDIKEIVAYAAERQIQIIPEIDIPGHSNAALAAYPQYACPVVDKFISVLPGLGGSNTDIIYCAGNDKTFEFLQGIMDEVTELFPSKYIHLGGDEAWKTYWKKCPLCQARIREEKLKDEEALQGYFMNRMGKYLQSKGKVLMGWDELTHSKIPEDAVIFGWQGYGEAALKAAAQGHRFVMTPARVTYLIRYQGPQWFEPLTYFGNITLKDVYDYEPVQKGWKPEYESLLMGVQACMWTEFCNKPEDVTYHIFPRLAALAEIAWAPKGTKDWRRFLKAMDNYTAHLNAKGIIYSESMYNIQHTVTANNGKLNVKLECIRPDVEIRYTTDGMQPGKTSALYTESLEINSTTFLKCATFANGKQIGQTLALPLVWNKATAKPILNAQKSDNLLTNGVRGSLRQSDFEWRTWDAMPEASFTIDLLQPEVIHEVALGCLTNYGMGAHKPKSVKVEVSEDNARFTVVGEKSFTPDEIFKEGNFIEDIAFKVNHAKARYVRVTSRNAGLCPENHLRPGQQSRYYYDEIIIK